MIGCIVHSKSGRDKGYFMVVVGQENGYAFVCDGKERPLERPKRKNIKHLSFTNTVLDLNNCKSNKSLRKELAIYKESAKQKEKP